VSENKLGISEQEPKPGRRHDNQGERRDKIPKALLRHRQNDIVTTQLRNETRWLSLMSTLRVNSGTALLQRDLENA
jgi:hypothetical protein